MAAAPLITETGLSGYDLSDKKFRLSASLQNAY